MDGAEGKPTSASTLGSGLLHALTPAAFVADTRMEYTVYLSQTRAMKVNCDAFTSTIGSTTYASKPVRFKKACASPSLGQVMVRFATGSSTVPAMSWKELLRAY